MIEQLQSLRSLVERELQVARVSNAEYILVMKQKISNKNQISPALTIRPSYAFLSYGM